MLSIKEDFIKGLQNLEKELQKDLSLILHQEELIWFQRSRAKWLTDGDRNTIYDHIKAVQRGRRKRVSMIKNENGKCIEDTNLIKNMFTKFYQNLFTINIEVSDWIQTQFNYPIIDNYKLVLDSDICDEEIKEALFDMSPWKAPGPDGYPAGFYQRTWNTIGSSMCSFIKQI